MEGRDLPRGLHDLHDRRAPDAASSGVAWGRSGWWSSCERSFAAISVNDRERAETAIEFRPRPQSRPQRDLAHPSNRPVCPSRRPAHLSRSQRPSRPLRPTDCAPGLTPAPQHQRLHRPSACAPGSPKARTPAAMNPRSRPRSPTEAPDSDRHAPLDRTRSRRPGMAIGTCGVRSWPSTAATRTSWRT